MTRSDFSASNMSRRVLCPGSCAMEAGLPDVRTDDSNEGTMLHALSADPTLSRHRLDHEQLETLRLNAVMQEEFEQFVMREHGLVRDDCQVSVETEWWYQRDGKGMFAMHPDVVLVWPKVVIVFDSKFGRELVPVPSNNWQLKTYLCGAAQWFNAEVFYGAITQPRVSKTIQSTRYTRDDIEIARGEINAAWDAAHKPDAPRRPSLEACWYCKGFSLGVCPDARTLALSPARPLLSADSPETTLARMHPDERAKLLEAFALCRKLDKNFTAAAKELVARDPNYIPGWKLVPGGERQTVTDALTLFNRLTMIGVTADEFIQVCTTPKGKLENLVRQQTKLKGRELDIAMDLLLKGVVDRTPISPSLERAA